jgi:hypothetical protein
MATYLKGIGDALSRTNEILPSLDAKINKFLTGHTAGVIQGEYNSFSAELIDRGVVVRSGILQAYGYFGCSDTDTQFNFILPTGTNYIHIYGEIDLSVVPNKFEIKQTIMSNSPSYTFVQDDLSVNLYGKYQIPLWQITLTSTGLALTDNRPFILKPLNSVNAEYATIAGTANALSSELSGQLDVTYLKVRRLHAGDSTYNAKPLSSNASYTIQAPTSSDSTIVVQGMLTCANKFWVALTLRRSSFLGYGCDTPALYWLRSVNGQPNVSYGFISLEASLSGNTLTITGWKINQNSNNYTESHARANDCYFALHSVFEIVNTNV